MPAGFNSSGLITNIYVAHGYSSWGTAANPTPPTTVVRHYQSFDQNGGVRWPQVVRGGFIIERYGQGSSWSSGGDSIGLAGPIWELQKIDLATGAGTVMAQQGANYSGVDPDPVVMNGAKFGKNGEILVPSENCAYVLFTAFSSQHNPGSYSAGTLSSSVYGGTGGGAKKGSTTWFLPAPPPMQGPYVIVQNRTGHFTSATSATIDIALFSNPDCSGENATHVMISVDGSPWANSNTFPHTETITGAGPHNIKVKGVANTIIGKTIDYSFTLQDNDWSASRLTPVKTIVHEFPDVGKSEATGFLNLYTKNADLENKQFYEILGKSECTANANTMEIIGETQSAYSYTRAGYSIAGSAQSIGGWESFEIYPDKVVGDLALGYADWLPDSMWMKILDTTDNISYQHSFKVPNSPWFSSNHRTRYSGAVEVEIPYTFKDGHSYEMEMYGKNHSGGHDWPLLSAGPDNGGRWAINNLSLNSFKLEISKDGASQSDTANVFSQLLTTKSSLSNTVIEFADVCWTPKPTDLDYLRGNRTHGYEMCVLMCGTNGMKVYDECVIPAPIVTQCDINSLPNSDGKYEFTSSGLTATLGVTGITTHAIRQHYYHMYFPVTDTHFYNHLPSDTAHPVTFSPEPSDTQVVIDIFNSCGSKETKTFDLKYVATTINTGTVSTGGGATGTTGTHVPTTSTGDRPSYHRLIVNSTRE